jgi:uncharacterized protein (TIGR03067 family)
MIASLLPALLVLAAASDPAKADPVKADEKAPAKADERAPAKADEKAPEKPSAKKKPSAADNDGFKPGDPADLRRLNGLWTVTSGERDGKALTASELAADRPQIRFEAGRAALLERGEMVSEGLLRLDDAATPKQIDLTYVRKGLLIFGVYKLDGDRLTVCFSAAGSARPDGFSAGKSSRRFLLMLERKR